MGASIGATAILSILELKNPVNGVLAFDFGSERLLTQVYKLRSQRIPTDYSNHSSISKALEYANKNHYSFILIQGDKDLKEKVFTLKNLNTGKESVVKEKDISKVITS